MAKVITFSRTFPAYHPKKGQPTYFVEKFLKGRPTTIEKEPWNPEKSLIEQLPLALDIWAELQPKYHTIRNGNRWKAGEYFSPRVWGTNINPKNGKSGPYHSNQIILQPDTLITKTYDFEVSNGYVFVNGKRLWRDFNTTLLEDISGIAKNDGLNSEDLLAWFKFPKPFKGQIICWNESINY